MTESPVKWPFPNNFHPSLSWRLSSRFIISLVGICSKIWGETFNSMQVHNKKTFLSAVINRKAGLPMVSVSNHHSCLDDPVLWAMLPWKILTTTDKMRWALSASDICYTRWHHAAFFSRGQCVPVVRGLGVYQRAVNFCLDRLNSGAWVHIFSEGQVNPTHELMRLKWGVGRLIADCSRLPLVIPFWHSGMDDILPNRSPYIPRIGQKVTVLIGEPLDFQNQLTDLRERESSPEETRKAITDIIQVELRKLQVECEEIHQQRILNTS